MRKVVVVMDGWERIFWVFTNFQQMNAAVSVPRVEEGEAVCGVLVML